MEEDGVENKRFGYKAIVLISSLALIVDGVTLIPFVGTVAGPVYWIILSYIFWRKGLGIVNWRRLAPTLVSFIIEIIPAVQALPSVFLSTILVLLLTKLEDKIGISIVKKPKVSIGRKPLNQNGIREPETKEWEIHRRINIVFIYGKI